MSDCHEHPFDSTECVHGHHDWCYHCAEELIRSTNQKAMSELLEIKNDAPVKEVSKDEFAMLWRVLHPTMRFGNAEKVMAGRDVLWCPGEKCWWELK